MKMKYFEKQMKKVFSKDKFRNYTITINKGDNVDEGKFDDNVCDVIVCYKDDFHQLMQENESMKLQINDLQDKILNLEAMIDKKTQSNKSSTSEIYEKLNEKVSEINNLKKSHQIELDKLKENNSSELLDVTEKHEKEIENITDDFNAKIDELEDSLSSKNAIIDEVTSKSKDEIHRLKEDRLKEINNLQHNHSKVISELQSENSQLKEDHLKKVNHLDNNNADKILELEKAHQDEVNQLNDEIASLKLKHKDEISELKQSHIDEVSDLKENQFNDECHMNIADHQKMISDIKDYLVNLRMRDHQDNMRFASDLEDLGFFEKHSSKYGNIIKEMKETDEKKLLQIDEDLSKYLIEAGEENNAIND